jgi:hypothetical protein
MHRKLILLDVARWRLAVVWFGICGTVFVVLAAQSLGGVYETRVQSAWAWALPNFVPTLALMVSVFAADALRPYEETRSVKVRETFFKLAMGLSIFYLLVLLATILAQPIIMTKVGDPNMDQVGILEVSNLWLAPLQGLVVAALGVLFFLRQDAAQPPKGEPNGSANRG